MSDILIHPVAPEELECRLPQLAELLRACVEGGASVSFVLPFTQADAEGFWRKKVAPAVQHGGRVLFVAMAGDDVAGSVQLDLDTPPNQPHRAEVAKLLVHPRYRRRGIARLLMLRLLEEVSLRGRTLVTLDTRTGDNAEPLYASLGFATAGVIPHFARAPEIGSQRLDATTYMYKLL